MSFNIADGYNINPGNQNGQLLSAAVPWCTNVKVPFIFAL